MVYRVGVKVSPKIIEVLQGANAYIFEEFGIYTIFRPHAVIIIHEKTWTAYIYADTTKDLFEEISTLKYYGVLEKVYVAAVETGKKT